MFRRIFSGLIALLLLLCPCRASATSAEASILVDADSGRVLFAENIDAKMKIASTTKLMTALVAIQSGRLQDTVTVSREAAGTEGSSMYLRAGEKLTLETLLYGLLLCSGNDAAVAIAQHVGGSVPGFVQKMNALARELGMNHSSFANPNGLDHPNHYSTARDMAVLGRAAVQNETLLRMASTRKITIGGRTMTNHNKLLRQMEGCIGLKTGYTRASGRTLVSCAERDGRRLVAVTLRDGNDWADHKALYDYGFSTYPTREGAVIGETVATKRLPDGSEVYLEATQNFSWPLRQGESLHREIRLTRPLTAPLVAGTPVGTAIFTCNGTEVGHVSLVCGGTVLGSAAMRMLKLPQ